MSSDSHPADAPPVTEERAREISRERWLMRAFQSPVVGPLLRCFADPQQILELGMAFWSSRVVLTAVEFGVFTELAKGPRSLPELLDRFGWHPRAAGAFLDALVGVGLLKRDREHRYANTRQADLFLDRAKPSYIGGLLELSSKRLYALWEGLDDLLRTGRPQASEEQGDNEFFATLYQDPDALREFLAGMTGISTGEAILIASRFPWRRYKTFVDVGSAQGALPVRVALTHAHLTGASYDLPPVGPIFEEYVASFGLSDRLRFLPGDMNEGPLPEADVICFGHLLHGYGETKRRELIGKAYAAIRPGGALLVYDAMIDPRRPDRFIGHLSSLNIMLETREGFEATTERCAAWLREAGFVEVVTRHLIGPTSMVYATKPANAAGA